MSVFIELAILTLPWWSVSMGYTTGVARPIVLLCLAVAIPIFVFIVYMSTYSLTIKADRVVEKGFVRQEVLFCDMVRMELANYKGGVSAVFFLRNGRHFGVDGSIKGFREAIERIERSIL